MESLPIIAMTSSNSAFASGQKAKNSYSELMNLDYFNRLLSRVKGRYSGTFIDMLISFLHFDPDVRVKADRLYRDYLVPIEKEIEAFDDSWLKIVEG